MSEDQKTDYKGFPPITLGLALGSALLIGAIVLWLVFPQYRRLQNLEKQKLETIIRLDEKKILNSVYAKAAALARTPFHPKLATPERRPIPRTQISTLATVFNGIARANKMTLDKNSLDIASLKEKSYIISLNVRFKGDFFALREVLISVTKLPYFIGIDRMDMTMDEAGILVCAAKVKISVEDNRPQVGRSIPWKKES